MFVLNLLARTRHDARTDKRGESSVPSLVTLFQFHYLMIRMYFSVIRFNYLLLMSPISVPLAIEREGERKREREGGRGRERERGREGSIGVSRVYVYIVFV